MLGASLLNTEARLGHQPGVPANENRPSRRVVVNLVPVAPITITEVEVFDLLIGSFAGFAANDNERPKPNPDAMHDPPSNFPKQNVIVRPPTSEQQVRNAA